MSNAHALGVNATTATSSLHRYMANVNVVDVARSLGDQIRFGHHRRCPIALEPPSPHEQRPSDASPSTTPRPPANALLDENTQQPSSAFLGGAEATTCRPRTRAHCHERRGERCNARPSKRGPDSVPMSRRGQPSAPRTGVHLCDLFRPFAFGQQIDEPSASRVTCCRRLLWRARRAHRARRGPTAGRTTTTRRRRTSRPTIAADARAAPAGADGRLNCPLRTRSQDAAPAA